MRLSKAFVIVPLALLAVAGTAVAGSHGFGHGFGHGERIEAMLEEVDATDEQQAAIEAILEANRPDHRSMHAEMKQARQDLFAALSADPVDTETVEALRQDFVDALDEKSQDMADALVEVAQVLTPEQRVELATLAEERAGQMESRMERFHGEGHGHRR